MDSIFAKYQETFGHVPENIRQRSTLAEQTGREKSLTVIEAMRDVLLTDNPLGPKQQQMVHFAMLIGAEAYEPARLHAQAALKAGATVSELFGICETAAVVKGMPGFSKAIEIIYDLTQSEPV